MNIRLFFLVVFCLTSCTPVITPSSEQITLPTIEKELPPFNPTQGDTPNMVLTP